MPRERAVTLVTFLVSRPTCTFVGLGDGLRLFRSFSSLLGGLDLSWSTENVYSSQGTRQIQAPGHYHLIKKYRFSWEGALFFRSSRLGSAGVW